MTQYALNVVKSALSEIGLNDVEMTVFSVSLSLGPRPASTIAKQAGLNRAHTYDVLATLKKKGLIEELTKNNIKQFSCMSPRNLLNLIESRENRLAVQRKNLEQALPILNSLQQATTPAPMVEYFQGVEALKRILAQTLEYPGEPLYAFTDAEYSTSLCAAEFANWREKFTSERTEKNIWFISIINDSIESSHLIPNDEIRKRKLKILKGLILPVEILIFKSKVAIFSNLKPNNGLLVDNQNVADTLRNLHHIVWNSLE